MGMYLHVTNLTDDIKRDVLGFGPEHEAQVKAINAKYRPLLDQQGDDFCEVYDTMEGELRATPELHMAAVYDYGGFGKIVSTCGHHDPDPEVYGGIVEGEFACDILTAQRSKWGEKYFQGKVYPADTIVVAAIDRTIAAVRAGSVRGVNWG